MVRMPPSALDPAPSKLQGGTTTLQVSIVPLS
jgi:hypothetical protein